MSVINGPLDAPEGSDQFKALMAFVYGPLAQADGCFYCGHDLTYPLVHWHGLSADIFLHPDCAAKLSQHLAADSLKAQRSNADLPSRL